jgi:membrane protease subunit (stomatin/prohibitin family)
VAVLTDHFAESRVSFLDMAANQVELGAAVAERLRPMFADLGLSLEGFQVQNVSLPEELQKRLDERIGMGVVGDLGRYTQFQTAQSIPVAAANEGGVAGAGAGLGAGIAMGQAMGQAMSRAAEGPRAGGPAAVACSGCARPMPPGARFCPDCGAAQTQALTCARCHARLEAPSKFCPECGASQA